MNPRRGLQRTAAPTGNALWPFHLFGMWAILAVVSVANGIARVVSYGAWMPELAAHQCSTLIGMVLVGLVVAVLSRVWPWGSATEAVAVGLGWIVLTVAFEFGFGHYVAGHSWEKLLADYDLSAGRLWIVFLAWLGILPWLNWYVGSGSPPWQAASSPRNSH